MSAIAVIGATGRTGRLVVERAQAAGHRVTAIARRANGVDLMVPGALRGLLDDHDTVISTIGAPGRGPTTIYSTGTAEILSAIKPGTRLLVLSSAGLATPDDAGPVARLAAGILHRIMHHTYDDMRRMEELLAASEANWTAVRPNRLTDQPANGRFSTSRSDLAEFLLDAIDDPRTYRTTVTISS